MTAAIGGIALAAAVIASVLLLTHLRRTLPAEQGRRGGRDAPGADPLARAERLVSVASSNAADFHLRLRPVLREIAASKLERRHVDLDAEPERARELLGDDAWGLLRPDRPGPDSTLAPGPPMSEIDRVLAALERV